MYNLESTIGSQYANSPVLDALIQDFNLWIDPTVNLQNFYSQFWNLETAQGSFLDQWGDILGVTRYVEIVSPGAFFGFNDIAADYEPFGQGPFYSGANATLNYALSDSAYQTLLFTKAFANICQTVIPVMNQLLQILFGADGVCFVADYGNMQMGYIFEWNLTQVQQAIIQQSGVLPHPTGVGVSIVDYIPTQTFGFNGSSCQPFGQGTFYT